MRLKFDESLTTSSNKLSVEGWEEYWDEAEKLLDENWFNITHQGYYLLASAICICCLNGGYVRSLGGDIYEKLALKFKLKPASVERNIRAAINFAKREAIRRKGGLMFDLVGATNGMIILKLANMILKKQA